MKQLLFTQQLTIGKYQFICGKEESMGCFVQLIGASQKYRIALTEYSNGLRYEFEDSEILEELKKHESYFNEYFCSMCK